IEAPAGNLYSGASGASGTGADPAAGSYGSFGTPDTSGDSVSVYNNPQQVGAYSAGGGLIGAGAGASAPTSAVGIYDVGNGGLLAGSTLGDTAGTSGASGA